MDNEKMRSTGNDNRDADEEEEGYENENEDQYADRIEAQESGCWAMVNFDSQNNL